LTATSVEFNAVGRVLPRVRSAPRRSPTGLESQTVSSHILLIQTGVGPDKARSVTKQILQNESWDVVISTGFAGALNAGPIGSLIVGSEVLFGQSAGLESDYDLQRIVCHPDWVNTSLSIQLMGPHPLQCGKFVTMDRVLTHASQKQILGKRTGAVAVDMESGAIGQVAQQHGLPFLIVRAISDGVNEDLPVDFNLFLKPSGWVGGARQVVSTPRCWKGFWRLYRNSKQAGLQLSRFFEKFFATIPMGASSIATTKTGVLNP
jgi:adenosylhomocysteine nucleosidase